MNPEPKSLKEAKALLAQQEQVIAVLQAQIPERTHRKDDEASNIFDEVGNESGEYLEAFFNNIVDIVTLAEIDTQRIIKVNTTATQLLGYSEEELLQLHIYDLDNERDKSAVAKNLKEIISEGQRVFEVQHKTKSGELINLLANARPVKIAQKYHILSLYTDITYLKQIEYQSQENLQKYDDLVNSVNGIIWEADLKSWHFTYVSQQSERLLGYTPQEWMNNPAFWEKHIHPDDLKNTLVFTKKQRNLKKSYSHEYRFITADGNIIWLQDIVSIILDDKGSLDLLRGVMIDITRQKETEEELRESEKRHRQMFEGNQAIKLLIDPDTGLVIDANPAARMFYGYSLNELKSMFIQDINQLSAPKVEQEMENARIENRSYFQFQHKLASGEIRDVEVRSGPIKLGNREVLYSIIHDITDRRQKEQEIQRLTNTLEQRVLKRTTQLEESNTELEAFAYSISHDLRAPLRAITGYSNILHADFSEDLSPQAQEYLQRIDQSGQKMDRLINDLLMLSRLGRQTLRIHEIDYCKMTKRIFAEQIKAFPERKFSLTPCNICPNINADPQLLEIMVGNLIANAIKFTNMREIPQIAFGATENDDKEIIYFIKDNGIGFDMKYAGKLFSPFQRLHSETEFKGTGIGLAIVKRVIQRHHGRIWVESEPDKGTTFYFTIGEILTT